MKRRSVLIAMSTAPLYTKFTTMNETESSESQTDSRIEATLKEFDGDVTSTYEHDAVIEASNPTDEYVTEHISLREHFGREIFSADVTIPPRETKEYTVLWHVDPPHRPGKKILYLTVGDTREEFTREEYTVSVHQPIHTSVPFNLPDEVHVGEQVEIPITLENKGDAPGEAHLHVTQHIATKDTGKTVLHNQTHTVDGGWSSDNEKTITVTFTPTEPGNHVFTIDGDLSETSTSISVVEQKEST